jgi:hypothetical protein
LQQKGDITIYGVALCAVAADDAVEERVAIFVLRRSPIRRKWSHKCQLRKPNKMRFYRKIDAIVFCNAANKFRIPRAAIAEFEMRVP